MWKRYCLSVILCVLAVFCIISEPANAVELTYNDFDVVYTSGNHPYCRAYRYGSRLSASVNGWSSYTNGDFSIVPSNATLAGYEQIRGINCGTANNNNLYVNVKAGDIASLYLRVTDVYPQQNNELYYVYSSVWKLSETDANSDFELDIVDIDEKVEWENNGRRIKLIKVTGIVQMDTTNPNFGITFGLGTPPSVMQQSAIDQIRTAIEPIEVQYFRPKERLDYTNQLDEILEAIGDISTSTSVKEGMEEALENEKEQIQDASDEGETAANDAGDSAEEDTATITEQMGDIIGVFQTQASDCVIPLNLGHGINGGNLNMCSQVPPVIKNLIGFASTAIVALVVVRLLHTIINTYLQFIESFQR